MRYDNYSNYPEYEDPELKALHRPDEEDNELTAAINGSDCGVITKLDYEKFKQEITDQYGAVPGDDMAKVWFDYYMKNDQTADDFVHDLHLDDAEGRWKWAE